MSSSFYKSNLMDGYDSTLIPPENVLKKESIKIDDDNVEAIQSFSSYPVEYPYRNIIKRCHNLIRLAYIFFVMSFIMFMMTKMNEYYEMSPLKYLDPCNSSTVIPLAEINNIKDEIHGMEKEMSCINTTARYNISTLTNEYLTEKYTNLSTASTKLEQKLQEQKDTRFACYRQNIEKRCEDKMSSRYSYNNVYVYFITCAILLTISYYYISKANKMDLSKQQLWECNDDYNNSKIMIYHACFFCVFFIASSHILVLTAGCDIEKDLDKFPTDLF